MNIQENPIQSEIVCHNKLIYFTLKLIQEGINYLGIPNVFIDKSNIIIQEGRSLYISTPMSGMDNFVTHTLSLSLNPSLIEFICRIYIDKATVKAYMMEVRIAGYIHQLYYYYESNNKKKIDSFTF